jgi:Xaa-Pro aminopeptidase
MAKGEPDVKEAKEAMDIAEANERAAMETVRLVRSDRDAAQAMGYWSRESASAGWEK